MGGHLHIAWRAEHRGTNHFFLVIFLADAVWPTPTHLFAWKPSDKPAIKNRATFPTANDCKVSRSISEGTVSSYKSLASIKTQFWVASREVSISIKTLAKGLLRVALVKKVFFWITGVWGSSERGARDSFLYRALIGVQGCEHTQTQRNLTQRRDLWSIQLSPGNLNQ